MTEYEASIWQQVLMTYVGGGSPIREAIDNANAALAAYRDARK